MKKSLIPLAMTVVLIGLMSVIPVRAQGVIPIDSTGPFVLDVPGGHYLVTQDLTFVDNGLAIVADNITLDLNGHSITGSGITGGPIGNVGIGAGSLTGTFPDWTITGVTGITIKNGLIADFDIGIIALGSNESLITEIQTEGTRWGIMLLGSNNNLMTENQLEGVRIDDSYGIQLINSDYNRISENRVTSFWEGIQLAGSSNNLVEENQALNNQDDGIDLEGSFLFGGVQSLNNTIRENTLTGNGGAGITMESRSDYNLISENVMSHNQVIVSNYPINGITFSGTISGFGIILTNSRNNRIEENEIVSNGRMGIILQDDANHNIVSENTVSENGIPPYPPPPFGGPDEGSGIVIKTNSSYNTIEENQALNNDVWDLYLDGSGTGNLWIENDYGTSSPPDL